MNTPLPNNTMTHTTQDKKYDPQFFQELEEVLDEHFPKIEEEGEAKRANRRGAALMLFTEANRIHSRLLASQKERVLREIKKMQSEVLPMHAGSAISTLSETIKKEI